MRLYTEVVVFALLAIGLQSGSALGAERAAFGFPKNAPSAHIVPQSLDYGRSTMIFPAGRSDQRFLVLNSGLGGQYFISSQTKKDGKFKMEWAAKLVPLEGESRGKGSLTKILAGDPFGLMLDAGAPKAARDAIEARGSYAIYQWDAVTGVIAAFAQDGATLTPDSFQDSPGSPFPDGKKTKAFLVTPEERRYLAKGS